MCGVKNALEEKDIMRSIRCWDYMSGDPTYITSHKDARSQIQKLDRDELLEEIVSFYLSCNQYAVFIAAKNNQVRILILYKINIFTSYVFCF
jgi:uncharacterized protein (UPF0297 family)